MTYYARLSLCAVVAIVLFSTAIVLLGKLGGQDLEAKLDLMRWTSRLGDEMRRADALEARSTPIIHSNFEKPRLVHELAAHRVTIREVLQQFRELNEAIIETAPNDKNRPPLDEASLRINLVMWLRKELAHQPSVVAELEREVAELPASPE